MKVVVYGTNDGYRILYATNDELSRIIARDMRKGAQSDSQLGQTAYSLAFVKNGCVFTKFVIIKDSLRSFATGTIAFSVFLGPDEAMKAEDVLRLLNELYSFYELKYIRNHYLNKGETVLIREDWTFVSDIISRYKPEEHRSIGQGEMNSGTADPAYVYYSDEAELQKYFDVPYQEEYRPYSLVFFVNSNFRGDDKLKNPLNVLRYDPNSDLTGKIDLNKYTLRFRQYAKGELRIDVKDKKSGKNLSNNNRIGQKDELQITWTKEFYQPKTKIGTWEEIGNEFITIDHVKREVSINDEIPLEFITRKFKIKTKNSKGDKLDNTEIMVKVGYRTEQKVENNEITLTEEDMQNRCTVHATNGNNFYSEQWDMKIADEKEGIVLTLHEHKIVEFDIKQEIEAKIKVQDESNIKIIGNNKIEFIDDAIHSPCFVKISAAGYESWKNTFYPYSIKDAIPITLNKHKKSWISRKENRPKVIAIFSVSLLCLVFAVWGLISFFSNDTTPLASTIETKIITYIEGDSLFSANLIILKTEWNDQKPKAKSGFIWYKPLTWGGSSNAKIDTTTNEYKKWDKTAQIIERAIIKRDLINDKSFTELKKEEVQYSPAQQKFKEAINNIDSNKYSAIISQINYDVSKLTLSQIADSINAIEQTLDNAPTTVTTPQQPQPQQSPPPPPDVNKPVATTETPKTSSAPKTPSVPTTSPAPVSEHNSEITDYLKSSKLKKAKLKEYKEETTNTKLKNSIDLALKFWSLDGSKDNSYFSYRQKLGNDPILRNSELKKIVDEQNKQEAPKYPNRLEGHETKNLNQINDLLKKQ